jgi:hypothetical protein
MERTLTASQSDGTTAERLDSLHARPSRRRADRTSDGGSDNSRSSEGECLFCETGGHFWLVDEERCHARKVGCIHIVLDFGADECD